MVAGAVFGESGDNQPFIALGAGDDAEETAGVVFIELVTTIGLNLGFFGMA